MALFSALILNLNERQCKMWDFFSYFKEGLQLLPCVFEQRNLLNALSAIIELSRDDLSVRCISAQNPIN